MDSAGPAERLRGAAVTEPAAERRCIVCPQLRPTRDARVYERAQVCEGCRSRLRVLLAELVEYYALVELEKGSAKGDRISGSRTPPLPLVATALDLTMPPHLATVHDMLHDQTGDVSAPTMLESWARDWQTYQWALLPEATVASLVAWLIERLTWACDFHPAIDDFAAELRRTVSALRPHGPRAELKKGVPCRECERVTLFRWPGSDFIECGSCPCLMTPEEYERWTQLISAPEYQSWVEEVVAPQRDDAA